MNWNLKIVLLILMAIVLPLSVLAADKGKLVNLLAEYAELKQRVQEVRDTRKSGYASEPKDLIQLLTDIQGASGEVMKFRKSEYKPGTVDKTQEVTTNLLYAYNAMSQIVQGELDKYIRSSDVGLQLVEKYQAIWGIVDPSIPSVNVSRSETQNRSVSASSDSSLTKPVSAGQLKLTNVVTSVSRYGVLFANFTVENAGEEDMKDFTVSCACFAPSGTQLNEASKTLFEIVRAKASQEYEGIEIGPAHKQTSRVRCQVVNAAPIR